MLVHKCKENNVSSITGYIELQVNLLHAAKLKHYRALRCAEALRCIRPSNLLALPRKDTADLESAGMPEPPRYCHLRSGW